MKSVQSLPVCLFKLWHNSSMFMSEASLCGGFSSFSFLPVCSGSCDPRWPVLVTPFSISCLPLVAEVAELSSVHKRIYTSPISNTQDVCILHCPSFFTPSFVSKFLERKFSLHVSVVFLQSSELKKSLP